MDQLLVVNQYIISPLSDLQQVVLRFCGAGSAEQLYREVT